MKILFLSDIHGVSSTLERALKLAEGLKPDRIVLLGDLLYHGPRNGVPDFYAPEKVAQILNGLKDRLVAVRGNCDAEVDQLMFEFPMMSDYALLDAGPKVAADGTVEAGDVFFLTHGHLWNEWKLPPVGIGTVLAHGHTHVPEQKKLPCGLTLFNPGSVSLPKGGSCCSFGFYDGHELKHYVI